MYDFQIMIDRIKMLKKERRLSNETLAELSGVSKGTLSKILGSETKDPQISNIIKIAQALEVSANFLIFGKNEPRDDEFLQLFAVLNVTGQSKVISYMHDLIQSGNYPRADSGSDAVSKTFGGVRSEFIDKNTETDGFQQ